MMSYLNCDAMQWQVIHEEHPLNCKYLMRYGSHTELSISNWSFCSCSVLCTVHVIDVLGNTNY